MSIAIAVWLPAIPIITPLKTFAVTGHTAVFWFAVVIVVKVDFWLSLHHNARSILRTISCFCCGQISSGDNRRIGWMPGAVLGIVGAWIVVTVNYLHHWPSTMPRSPGASNDYRATLACPHIHCWRSFQSRSMATPRHITGIADNIRPIHCNSSSVSQPTICKRCLSGSPRDCISPPAKSEQRRGRSTSRKAHR